MPQEWIGLNTQGEEVPNHLQGTFIISSPPKTDIWRPGSRNVFDAPAWITKVKADAFKSMQVNVSGHWKTRYDQGGLLLAFPGKSGAASTEVKSWIKAGIENEEGTPMLGVVGTHHYSDWSLTPLLDDTSTATIKFVRKGDALWIYAVHGGKDIGLREVTWAFLEDRVGDAEIWVGVYAAKPTPDEDNEGTRLEVTFKDFRLETN